MFRKTKKFLTLDNEEKKLFLEAFITLGLVRVSLLLFSFKRLTHTLEHTQRKNPFPKLNEQQKFMAKRISKAIIKASLYTPWESACLVQSLTARKMLEKRGIGGVFYLGVTKDETSKEAMSAHSWSQCDGMIVTGENGHQEFTILSIFHWGHQ